MSCLYVFAPLVIIIANIDFSFAQSYEFDSGIQVINLTRNNFVELKRHIFYTVNLLNLQKIYLQKGR